jgi:hypothetical protein
MVDNSKIEVHPDNGLPLFVLSGRSHSSSGGRRILQLRKSPTVWIWSHDRRTDDYKVILNSVRKFMKNK